MFCQKCGKPIADGSVNCPYCGEPIVNSASGNDKKKAERKKNRKVGCLCGAVIIIAMIAIIAVIISSGDDAGTTTNTNGNASISQEAEEKEPTLIYEDEYVKASFIKVYSDKNVDSIVDGVAYLQLHVENKSNQTFTVSLSKAAINGMSTTIGSGVPMTLLPGNASEQPFVLFTKNTGVNNADEINKIQFSFYLLDENTKTLEETKTITVNVK